MDVTKLFNEETRDLMSKYAIAMGVTPEELYGAFLGAMQPLINKSIQIGDRDIKNDVNVVVVDTSGNAGKCARRLQGIHNQLLDPQEAKRLVEEDSKRVECDPVTGKQRANLDENTTNGLFVLKAEDVYGALQNKTPLGHNYTFIGNAPGTFKVQPRNSEKTTGGGCQGIMKLHDSNLLANIKTL
ncbi:uncharacterized protein LOC129595766 [Paramacrobiotus metropolitanus]|uniref:uncharacterized protein LOC129595766 n=1 Tax=Paramacrobiotus metropolitanus TaxID=2943436 RepID=UPI002445C375|nr:uncharacterized protein LOC129595766 [Paramacrobiotus metropolitanus]